MFKKLLVATTALFLSMAGPVAAGPLVGGIGALIGSLSAGGLTLAGIATGLLSMGAQWLIGKMLTPDQKQRGIKDRMETGGDNPPSFIVGEYATPGQLIYANTIDGLTNIPESLLVYVIQLSCLPITNVSSEVFVSNERCELDLSETFSGGFYAVKEYVKGTGDGGYLSMKFHFGGQNTADNWLLDKFGSDPDRPWNNNMFLPGCAYVIVRAWYSNRGIWTGMPTFRFVVQGAKVYDPRKDGSLPGVPSGPQRWNNPGTWEYSKNPKVIQYNIHRGLRWNGDHVWGGQAEAYRLPLEYWFAAMNACDENITKKNGDTIKRYEMGAEISLDDRPIEIIREIDKSCDGYTTEYGGTYKTWAGGPGLAVGTITDDDFLITEEMESNLFQGRENTYNTVYASYPEPRQQWEAKDAPRYQNEDALAEDGEELPLNLSLPFVFENNQVQRLGRSAIKDSRRQVTHGGTLPPRAWVYEPYDLLNYKSETFGYTGTGKKFIIGSKDDLPNVNQIVLLREINPNDQGYVPADEQDFDAAKLVVLRPGALDLDVNVFPDQTDSPRGKDKPAIRAEWTWGGADVDVQHIDWRLRRAGTTKVIAEGKIKRADNGEAFIAHSVLRFGKTYELQFRPHPFAIRESKWTGWKSVTCAMVDVPGKPTLTPRSRLGSDGRINYYLDISWTEVGAEGGYAVRTVIDGVMTRRTVDESPYRISVTAGSTIVADVASIGADGTRGDWSETQTITISKKSVLPDAPTSLTAVGKIGRINLKTVKHGQADFDHWNLYGSDTNNFANAVLIDDPKSIRFEEGDLGNGVERFYWITAVDNSGNESTKFPAGNLNGRSATTKLVVAGDLGVNSVETPHVANNAIITVKVAPKTNAARMGWTHAGNSQSWSGVNKSKSETKSLGGAAPITNPNPSAVWLRISFKAGAQITAAAIYHGQVVGMTVQVTIWSAPVDASNTVLTGQKVKVYSATVLGRLERTTKKVKPKPGKKTISNILVMDVYKGASGSALRRKYWAEATYKLNPGGAASVDANGWVKGFRVEGAFSKR